VVGYQPSLNVFCFVFLLTFFDQNLEYDATDGTPGLFQYCNRQ